MLRDRIRSLSSISFVLLASFCTASLLGGAATSFAAMGDCGQPASGGSSPVATDALFILGAAVAVQTCELCVCDVNDDTAITATDALTTLAAAVGQPIVLDCPSCGGGGVSCFESQAPVCGGICEEAGLTCVPDPEEPDECECLNACEASAAPTCGGSCEADEDGTICTNVSIAPSGLNAIDICECLPPNIVFCDGASAPQCDGQCGVGQECVNNGDGGCFCESQPVQPECTSASAPTCAGTCVDAQDGGPRICESNGDGCGCVPFVGQGETCFAAQAPICGGVCAFGEACATEDGICECVAACELSNAPSCGGDCYEDDESCIVTTIRVGDQMKDFCECWSLPE
jgi:hypothetical protein